MTSLGLTLPEAIALAVVLFCMTVPWFRIFRRAGYSPAAGLLMFLPPINIFMFLLFAYQEWPVERNRKSTDAHHFFRR